MFVNYGHCYRWLLNNGNNCHKIMKQKTLQFRIQWRQRKPWVEYADVRFPRVLQSERTFSNFLLRSTLVQFVVSAFFLQRVGLAFAGATTAYFQVGHFTRQCVTMSTNKRFLLLRRRNLNPFTLISRFSRIQTTLKRT